VFVMSEIEGLGPKPISVTRLDRFEPPRLGPAILSRMVTDSALRLARDEVQTRWSEDSPRRYAELGVGEVVMFDPFPGPERKAFTVYRRSDSGLREVHSTNGERHRRGSRTRRRRGSTRRRESRSCERGSGAHRQGRSATTSPSSRPSSRGAGDGGVRTRRIIAGGSARRLRAARWTRPTA
jgi:hypothetical protein